ncbi:MAG: glycosyltransferase family 4 protein [Oscillospiraceae bacterium]|nr:glycosyltransferase family 4 protein [Oscillospiraceae bacterium]
MKLLVVSQYFYPEQFRINDLCRELVRRGHAVTVLTGYPQYPGGVIYQGYGFDKPYETSWHGVRICRVRTHPRGKSIFGMLRNCVSFVAAGNQWVRNCTEKFDAVYVFEVSPVTVGLPALVYSEKFRVPMYFNLQDLWPDNVHEVLGIRFPPLTWAINRIVDRIYAGSHRILCASRGFVESLTERGVERSKLVYWPQFCPEPELEGKEKPEVYRPDDFNMVFAGNLGDAQGLDLLVDAAEALRGRGVRWYLVGDGRARARLEKLVRARNLQEDVIFLGRMDPAEADRYVRFADCAYLSFQNNPLFNKTLPAKLQTYLACGTPILAAAGGESARVIREASCGLAVKPERDALVAAALEMAALPPETRRAMSAAGRKYYEEHFTMDRLVDRLEAMLARQE